MIYITHDQESDEIVIRPIKEIRFGLSPDPDVISSFDFNEGTILDYNPEPTKIIDFDGYEVDYDKEKKSIFIFHITDHFFEIFDEIRKKIERRKELENL